MVSDLEVMAFREKSRKKVQNSGKKINENSALKYSTKSYSS